MFIGGAHSIDWQYRIKGFSWWEDEELSQPRMLEIMDTYMKVKPDVMVTHDAPIVVIKEMHSHHMFDNSRTQQFFQALWNEHKPKLWIFGHHHKSFRTYISDTEFVCLDELEIKEFDV